MYLSWTDDVPIVYPPYTCATKRADECLTLMGVHVAGATAPRNQCLLAAEFALGQVA
jgi:hypothetical protein